MSDTFKFVQAQPFTLAGSGVSIGGSTMVLTSFTDIDGANLLITDFGTIGFGTVEPGNGEQEEQISFSGVTQNANGTATLTGIKTVLFKSPYTQTSNFAKSHSGGVQFVISNTAGFYDQLDGKGNDETITGKYTFPAGGSANAPVSGTVYSAPTDDLEYASKKYVDNVAVSGAPNATTGVKGIVQLATAAQTAAGTAVGSTGANLVPQNATFNATSSAAITIPVTDAAGKLSAGFGGSASTLATLSAGSLVVQNPANATATPTAAKIPIADGSGLLDGWVTNRNTTITLTTGEAIDGSTTPQVVCILASDGLVYKADGNTNTKVQAFGFVTTNALITTAPAITVTGIVAGFTGLTKDANYYVSDTAGSITATPSTSCAIPVGIAISATQLLLKFGRKTVGGTIAHSRSTSGNDDQTVTLGFRPTSLILFGSVDGILDGNNYPSRGTYGYFGTAVVSGVYLIANDAATALTTSNWMNFWQLGTPASATINSGANRGWGTLTISAVSDTGFTSRMAVTVSAGSPTVTGTVNYIAYE